MIDVQPAATPARRHGALSIMLAASGTAAVLAGLSATLLTGFAGRTFADVFGLFATWAVARAIRDSYGTKLAAAAVIPLVCLFAGAFRLPPDADLTMRGHVVEAVVATKDARSGGPRSSWWEYTFTDRSGRPVPGNLKVDTLLQPWGPRLDIGERVRLRVRPGSAASPRVASTVTPRADAAVGTLGLLALTGVLIGGAIPQRRRRDP